MVRKGTRVLMLLVIGGLIGGSLAVAQTATHPFTLNASVRSDGKVTLNWTRPPGDSVRHYLVYRASLPNALTFMRIDSTTKNEFTDAPPTSSVPPVFLYYVEAIMKAGATLRSNTVTVYLISIPRVDVVRILSEPVKTGRIGTPYSYQVRAVSSDSTAKLRYELLWRPSNMTIDSTGLIKWTPDKKGIFGVHAGVYSNKGGKAGQQYYITVTGPTGTVAGTATDTTGKLIPKVTVRLYGRDRDSHFEYNALTDSLGKYKIAKVDFGTYIARAVPMKGDYLEQWYDGVATADKAKPIEVKDTVVVSIDFKLKSKVVIPIFIVSGTVLDTLKKPVKDAWVAFALSSFGFNSARPSGDDWSGGDDHRDMFDLGQMRAFAMGVPGAMLGMDSGDPTDFRLDGNSIFVVKTKVDSLGKYSIKLPQGAYIAHAWAPGYYRVFYNNRSDFLSADIIKVQADVQDINFALKPVHPLAFGKINGSVVDSVSRGGVISRVIAFRLWVVGRDTLIVPRAYYDDTDSLGVYSIAHLPPGDYIVLAIPLGHYVPSYYSVNGSTRLWQEATKVNVNGNTVAGITIYVVPTLRSATGYSSIGGNVRSSTGTSNSLGKSSGLVGIEGSLVYAADNATGQVAGYGVTNTDGSFTIAELAPGSYTVTVGKLGYSSMPVSASPTYSAAGAPIAATVSLNIDAVVTDVARDPVVVPTDYELAQNYPNPFNPSTQILFSIPRSEKVLLTIYNVLGQKIATPVDGTLAAGTHAVTWNGRDAQGMQLPSGVYFYTLRTANYGASKKMVMLR